MKRDGGILILVMVITALCITTMIFVLETVVIQSKLVQNRRDNIQTDLLLENEISKLIYEKEDILNLINEYIRNPRQQKFQNPVFPLYIDGMEEVKGELSYSYCNEERLTYELIVSGNMNGVKDKITANGHVFNSVIDHCNDGIIHPDNKSLDEAIAIEALIHELKEDFNPDYVPADLFLASGFLENQINIRAKSSGYRYIEFVRENSSTECSFWNGRIVLFKKYDGFNRDIIRLGKDPTSKSTGLITGVIYLENGDFIMKDDVTFNGILILGNGRLIKEGEVDSYVKGKVILNTYDHPDKGIQITYNHDVVRQMSSFLPGFISPTIDSIR